MGFNIVYKVLLEIFPEVDSRALRAVAIEHQKDADLAVEAVLTEVIPFLSKISAHGSSLSANGAILQSPEAAEVISDGTSSKNVLGENMICADEEQYCPFYDAKDEHDQTFEDSNDELYGPEEVTLVSKFDERCATNGVNSSEATSCCVSPAVLMHENGANGDADKKSGELASEEFPSVVSQESSTAVGCNQISQLTLKPLAHENLVSNQSLDNCLHADSSDGINFEKSISVENSDDHLSPSIFEPVKLTSPGSTVQLVGMPYVRSSNLEEELNGPKDAATEAGPSYEVGDVAEEPMNTVVTRSGKICSTDLLEDIIADARNNKKILLSSVQTVINLMKEVEFQEEAAEQAKEDAANGGLETLKGVEDLKKMLQHAKEANNMHAGEVYGEKAILATEVRELQSRLFCLSDERDKSLGILDEMRQSLEMRLAVAEKERKLAEEEKLKKEDMAWEALKIQEVVMEKVVEEANILKREAEENAKVREFLIDRGRVVDTLQGEISVICTDVRFLKEKFDERLPLSKSLTSNQTSCIVASSSSSSKSTTSEQVDQITDLDPSESLEKTDSIPLLKSMTSEQVDQVTDDQSESLEKTDFMPPFNVPKFIGTETTPNDKDLRDEGWEIFDTRDAYM